MYEIRDLVEKYLDDNKLIHDSQYGFCKVKDNNQATAKVVSALQMKLTSLQLLLTGYKWFVK